MNCCVSFYYVLLSTDRVHAVIIINEGNSATVPSYMQLLREFYEKITKDETGPQPIVLLTKMDEINDVDIIGREDTIYDIGLIDEVMHNFCDNTQIDAPYVFPIINYTGPFSEPIIPIQFLCLKAIEHAVNMSEAYLKKMIKRRTIVSRQQNIIEANTTVHVQKLPKQTIEAVSTPNAEKVEMKKPPKQTIEAVSTPSTEKDEMKSSSFVPQISIRKLNELRGKVISVPKTMQELKSLASTKLNIVVEQIWNASNDEVDEIQTIISLAQPGFPAPCFYCITKDQCEA